MKKDKTVNKVHVNRFIFIFGLLLFLVIIARLIYLNLSDNIDGINLKKFAKNRNTTKETLYAKRGSIYDLNGEVLAQTVDSYTLIAYLDESRSKNSIKPRHVVDKEETAKKLATVIDMEEDRILKILNQKGLYPKKHIDAGTILYKDEETSGASGPACLPLVFFYNIINNKKYKKILLLSTGSLHNPEMVNQKETIPAITNAVTIEVIEN